MQQHFIMSIINTTQKLYGTYELYLNNSNEVYTIAEQNNFNDMHECANISFSQIKCCGYDNYKQNFIKLIESSTTPSIILKNQI